MADKRIKCICTKNASNVIVSHRVLYSVESGSNKAQLMIVVKASEMTNPADDTELKTKADAKAVIEKAKWVTRMATQNTQHVDATVAGDVTL